MNSPWQVPLPLTEQTKSRVVVYFYRSGWIPITFYPLVDAIKLHLTALSTGMDIVVFPADIDPRSSDTFLSEAHHPTASEQSNTEPLTDKYSQYATKTRVSNENASPNSVEVKKYY